MSDGATMVRMEKRNAGRRDAKSSDLEVIAANLWADPSEKNWEKLYSSINSGKVKYYKIVYKTLKNSQDLTKSFALLYDSRMRQVAKIPIIKRKGNAIEGATIYLKGLRNANIF